MPRKFYSFTLTVRPHRRNVKGTTRKRPPDKLTKVVVVAGSKFDAELMFRNANPRMMVVGAERGEQVDPPSP